MPGANYMGGKRNAAKAMSKDTTTKKQRAFFGRKRLEVLGQNLEVGTRSTAPLKSTRKGFQKALLDMDLGHAKRSLRKEKSMCNLDANHELKKDVWHANLSSSSAASSKAIEALDSSDPICMREKLDRILNTPDLSGLRAYHRPNCDSFVVPSRKLTRKRSTERCCTLEKSREQTCADSVIAFKTRNESQRLKPLNASDAGCTDLKAPSTDPHSSVEGTVPQSNNISYGTAPDEITSTQIASITARREDSIFSGCESPLETPYLSFLPDFEQRASGDRLRSPIPMQRYPEPDDFLLNLDSSIPSVSSPHIPAQNKRQESRNQASSSNEAACTPPFSLLSQDTLDIHESSPSVRHSFSPSSKPAGPQTPDINRFNHAPTRKLSDACASETMLASIAPYWSNPLSRLGSPGNRNELDRVSWGEGSPDMRGTPSQRHDVNVVGVQRRFSPSVTTLPQNIRKVSAAPSPINMALKILADEDPLRTIGQLFNLDPAWGSDTADAKEMCTYNRRGVGYVETEDRANELSFSGRSPTDIDEYDRHIVHSYGNQIISCFSSPAQGYPLLSDQLNELEQAPQDPENIYAKEMPSAVQNQISSFETRDQGQAEEQDRSDTDWQTAHSPSRYSQQKYPELLPVERDNDKLVRNRDISQSLTPGPILPMEPRPPYRVCADNLDTRSGSLEVSIPGPCLFDDSPEDLDDE